MDEGGTFNCKFSDRTMIRYFLFCFLTFSSGYSGAYQSLEGDWECEVQDKKLSINGPLFVVSISEVERSFLRVANFNAYFQKAGKLSNIESLEEGIFLRDRNTIKFVPKSIDLKVISGTSLFDSKKQAHTRKMLMEAETGNIIHLSKFGLTYEIENSSQVNSCTRLVRVNGELDFSHRLDAKDVYDSCLSYLETTKSKERGVENKTSCQILAGKIVERSDPDNRGSGSVCVPVHLGDRELAMTFVDYFEEKFSNKGIMNFGEINGQSIFYFSLVKKFPCNTEEKIIDPYDSL